MRVRRRGTGGGARRAEVIGDEARHELAVRRKKAAACGGYHGQLEMEDRREVGCTGVAEYGGREVGEGGKGWGRIDSGGARRRTKKRGRGGKLGLPLGRTRTRGYMR